VAALTILSHNETSELSLQQHLELAPDLVATYNPLVTEGDSEPLMMAQPVPHQATDKKRVKVYELRNNDWYDRGTGFCTATYTTVRSHPIHAIYLIRPIFLRLRAPRFEMTADPLPTTDRRWAQRPTRYRRVRGPA
jgi:hypothetical protein